MFSRAFKTLMSAFFIGLPALLGPDFNVMKNSEDNGVFAKTGVVAQKLRDKNAALGVGFGFTRRRQQHAFESALFNFVREWEMIKLSRERLPRLRRKEKKTPF